MSLHEYDVLSKQYAELQARVRELEERDAKQIEANELLTRRMMEAQARVRELEEAPRKLLEQLAHAQSDTAELIEQVRELEADLRREWWINHGHDYHALYGDDGEMQCARCMADFKRQPIEELRKIVFDARLQKASALERVADARADLGRHIS